MPGVRLAGGRGMLGMGTGVGAGTFGVFCGCMNRKDSVSAAVQESAAMYLHLSPDRCH